MSWDLASLQQFALANVVHLGYGLQLLALLARDVLWLRGLLVCAQSLNAFYAFHIGADAIGGWNAVFVAVNLYWILRILRERQAVQIPADLQELYTAMFAALKPREFLSFWAAGQPFTEADTALLQEGSRRPPLILLQAGRARVRHGQAKVVELEGPVLLGEISALTGRPATADVDLLGIGHGRRWERPLLEKLRLADAGTWTRIQSVIGGDLVRKLQVAERNGTQAGA